MNTSDDTTLDPQTAKPFLLAAAAWLVLGLGLCAGFSGAKTIPAMLWMALLWVLCLFDLYALSRAVGAALAVMSDDEENRGPLIVRALYWGVIKLTCLGILGAALSYGRSIPVTALLMGIGTAVVVPLVGGYGWSQKVLRHARG